MTLREFLNFFDFDYKTKVNEDNELVYMFIDLHGDNLGGICFEEYYKPSLLVERIACSIYWSEFIERDLEEEFGYNGNYSLEDEYVFCKEHKIPYIDIVETALNYERITE